MGQDCDLKLLVISCGSGWGHAIPDMVIIKRLMRVRPLIQVVPVSYADGAEAYKKYGWKAIDLANPRNYNVFDLILEYLQLFRIQKPHLVVAHEEYAALVAAKALEIPCLFLTDFFMDPLSLAMQALKYAAEVIFLGEPGFFTEPPFLLDRLYYAGYVGRDDANRLLHRTSIRKRHNISPKDTVVLYQPGSWSEVQNPIFELLAKAWVQLPRSNYLLVITNNENELFREHFDGLSNIIEIPRTMELGKYMCASDVLITKCNRQTVYEATAIGLPSISLSNGLNWPDDVVMNKLLSNMPFEASRVTPEELAEAIAIQATRRDLAARKRRSGAALVAKRIGLYCDALLALR